MSLENGSCLKFLPSVLTSEPFYSQLQFICQCSVLPWSCRYRLRSKVDIDNVGKEFYCWQRYGGNLSDNSSTEEPEAASVGWGGNVDRSAVSSSRGTEGGWEWFKDPRLDCLGFRGIFPSDSTREF